MIIKTLETLLSCSFAISLSYTISNMKNIILFFCFFFIANTAIVAQTTQEGDYVFIDVDNEERLRDIIMQFNDYVVYMDIWATWCAACINEFKYKKGLDNHIKNKDVKLLYIAIDRPERKDQWKEMIVKYDLKGYHIFASTNLENQLRDVFGYNQGTLDFPHFTIFKKNSDIGVKDAMWPNSKQSLYSQIDSFLK